MILEDADRTLLREKVMRADWSIPISGEEGRTIQGDAVQVLSRLAPRSVDLMIADPPYNLSKSFNGFKFVERSSVEYEEWLHTWIPAAATVLKPTASLYVCSEWRSSGSVQKEIEKYFTIRNRITWEREKGRGALYNWKNCHEDIWFCTVSDEYHFDVEAVKQRKEVIAPYRDEDGKPKDWNEGTEGNFRLTHPSNLWTDISVPFWSMPENTDHPTQKPEKLIAKMILASSRPGDLVLDPFLGSGTTSVVAKKLGRRYVGIEIEDEYCLLAEKRLAMASRGGDIQGYSGGCFWDRNTLPIQQKQDRTAVASAQIPS